MKKKIGRPTKFEASKCERAEKLCKLGATDKTLADAFGIAESTLNKWKLDYPEFMDALKRGKEVADAEVASKLFERATGYSHPDVHISNFQGVITKTEITKHYPPDATSAIFWLKNRRPELWRDRTEHTGANGAPLVPSTMDNLELARRMAFILSEADGAIEKAANSSKVAAKA